MNCEAYIAYSWNGQTELFPNNIDTAFLAGIFADIPYGKAYSNCDWLVIKRKDEMLYYAFIVTLADAPQERLCLMAGLNDILIADPLALVTFMRPTLRDITQRCRIARYDADRGVYARIGSDSGVAKLPEAQAMLRNRFNERFDGCGARPGAHDYSASPGIDMYAMLPDGRTRHVVSPSSQPALSLARSVEAGNTVMIQSRREDPDPRPAPDNPGPTPYPTPTPPKPETHDKPATSIGGAIIGILAMFIILMVIRNSAEWISPEIMNKYVSCLERDPFIDAFHSVSIKIGLPAGALVWYVGTFFKSFLKAALITYSLVITLFIAVGFYPVHETIFEDTPISDLVETSVLYGLFSICCGMICCKLLTGKKPSEKREDTQALRNKGYMRGLGIALIWSGIYFVTTHTMAFSGFHVFVIVWLLPGVCGAAAGWLRRRNVWIYRSSLICSAGAAAVLFPIYPHEVLVPAVLFGTFAITVALLRDLFTETTGTNPARQPIAYNPE